MTTGLVRRLGLSGDYADLDWTDPAILPPGNARRFKCTGADLLFDVIGKASTLETAVAVDIGTLEVDAWVGYEAGPIDPADRSGPKNIRRGASVVEVGLAPLSARIRVASSDVQRGGIGRIHLTLTTVGALPAVDVILVSGGRPL